MEETEQQVQQEIQQPENHETRYELLMIAVFAVIAIPMFSFFFGKAMHKQPSMATKQQVMQEKQPQTPTQISIVPVLIKHKQDIDNALKMVDGINTTAVEQQLNQVDSNASGFSQ